MKYINKLFENKDEDFYLKKYAEVFRRNKMYCELVSVDNLKKLMLTDRDDEDYKIKEYSDKTIGNLVKEIRSGKLKEPLILKYDSKKKMVVLGEGHHRLAAIALL